MELFLSQPATLKVLLALASVEQAYKFQIIRLSGVHSIALDAALKILLEGKLVQIVRPRVYVKNAGNFYALTAHGRGIAVQLQGIAKSLEGIK